MRVTGIDRCANNLVRIHQYCTASRQSQIVALGGLKLLLPLARSTDIEVQRLAVHALANLSVDGEQLDPFELLEYHVSPWKKD